MDLAIFTPDALECEPPPHYEPLHQDSLIGRPMLITVQLAESGRGVRWDKAN